MRELLLPEVSLVAGGQVGVDGASNDDWYRRQEERIEQLERQSAHSQYVDECVRSFTVVGGLVGVALGGAATAGAGALGGAAGGSAVGAITGAYVCPNDGNAREILYE